MKKAFAVATLLLLTGCKTINITIYDYPASGSIEIDAEVSGSDIDTEAKYR